MQVSPRFGAVIPVIGEVDDVRALTQKITDKAAKQGLKSQVVRKHLTWDPFSSRKPNAMVEGVVVLTGKDADRHDDLQNRQIPAYHKALDQFFDTLYKAVGKPVHERDFKGTTGQYRKYWQQYSQKVKNWMQNNPWPQVPDDSDFVFNIPNHYKRGVESDAPNRPFYEAVHQTEDRLNQGTLDISG